MGTLTRSQLETEVRAGIGNRTDLNDRLVSILNISQDIICRAWPFYELQTVDTGNMTVDQGYITVSSRSRDVHSVRLLDDTKSRKLIYVPTRKWDLLIPYPASYTTSRPEYYTYYRERFELWRIPDDTYSYEIRRVKWPTAFSAGSDIASDFDGKDELIIAIALAYIFRQIETNDGKKGYRWKSYAQQALRAAIKEDQEKTDYAIGGQYKSGVITDYWLDPFVPLMP